jgi:hypothetical protein
MQEEYNKLRSAKKAIIKSLVQVIKTDYSTRTKEYKKCSRDLEYIYSSISSDILNTTNDQTRLVGSKFWHKGQRQIKTIEVEFAIYDLLAIKLKEVIPNKSIELDALINKLKEIIENGPDLLYSEEVMQERRNMVLYDSKIKVPSELESFIDNTIMCTPSQLDTHFGLFKLKENDQHIKDFLVENFFLNDAKNPTRHMVAVSSAPLVYVAQLIGTEDFSFQNQLQAIGIHGGAIMETALSYGYDFSFIGCGPDTPVSQSIQDKWKDIMLERWGIAPHPEHPEPQLCFCIGKGVFENLNHYEYTLPSTGKTVLAQYFDVTERKDRSKKLFY